MPRPYARVSLAQLAYYLEQIQEHTRRDLLLFEQPRDTQQLVCQAHLLGRSALADALLLLLRTGNDRELRFCGAQNPWRPSRRARRAP
jgi:hypothetical protein